MVRDRSTPTQDMSPERLTQPKKKKQFLIKPTLHWSPPKKKKGVSVLPAKRSLYRIHRDSIPVGERREEKAKIGLASVHVYPPILPSWEAIGPCPFRPLSSSRRAGEIVAAVPPPPPCRAAAYVCCWDRELIKSSAFWGESKLYCSPLCRSLITAG